MTLTLDEDVAILLDRARQQQGRRLEELGNEALRRGLRQLVVAKAKQPAPSYTTPSVSAGRCFIANVDDIAAVLAAGEGEGFRWTTIPTASRTLILPLWPSSTG